MRCCCTPSTDDGATPGAPAGDAAAFAAGFDILGGLTVNTPLVDLAAIGAVAMLRSIHVSSWAFAGFALADFGVTWALPAWTAQRNAVESFAYGAPNGAAIDNAGYQSPGVLGAAGYGAVGLAIVGTQVVLQTTGLAAPPGITTRWRVRGFLDVFDGAVRLIS